MSATFRSLLSSHPDLSTGVAAIRTLTMVLASSKAFTLQELVRKLNLATEEMKREVGTDLTHSLLYPTVA